MLLERSVWQQGEKWCDRDQEISEEAVTSIRVRRGPKAWTDGVQWRPSEAGSNVGQEKGTSILKSGQESEGEGDAGL